MAEESPLAHVSPWHWFVLGLLFVALLPSVLKRSWSERKKGWHEHA
jgi:hypothetical protein